MNKNNTPEKEWLRRLSGESKKEKSTNTDVGKDNTEAKSDASPTKPTGIEVKKKPLSFKDVAGMTELKTLIQESFINPLNNKEMAESYGLHVPSILLVGPPGCGKTFISEALATEVGVNYIYVSPDDLASTYVHGTQKLIGKLFDKAERQAPTVIFIDEIESILPSRSSLETNTHTNGEVDEMLVRLNNASQKGVYVIGATNRPDCIDVAAKRTGRFDEKIYVGMPDKEMRMSLFRLKLSKLPVDDGIDYNRLAELTQNFNCSDIDYTVSIAARKRFNDSLKEGDAVMLKISQQSLEDAIAQSVPSIDEEDLKEYERLRDQLTNRREKKQRKPIGFHIQ